MNPYAGQTPRTVMHGLLGKKIKLSPEIRLERRRARNRKAQGALRHRRWTKGLRGDGKVRKRPWRETVTILGVEQGLNGEQWIRVSPIVRLKKEMKVMLIMKSLGGN